MAVFSGDRTVGPQVDGQNEILDRDCVFKVALACDELTKAFLEVVYNLELGFTLCRIGNGQIVFIAPCGNCPFANRREKYGVSGAKRQVGAHIVRLSERPR